MDIELKIQKILLSATELVEAIREGKIITLYQEVTKNVAIFKQNIMGYSQTFINFDGIKSSVLHDNTQFLMLTIRSLLIFGFLEIIPADYNINIDEILGNKVENED